MVELGECLYYNKEKRHATSSLYRDFAGDTLENEMVFPVVQRYKLSQAKRVELYEIVLEDKVRHEIIESTVHNVRQIQ